MRFRLPSIAFAAVAAGSAMTLATVLALSATSAQAQRSPAYQAARSAGQVGEQPDGYLGVVGTQPASVQQIVDDLNIRRREEYTRRAAEAQATVEQFAFTTGCNLIARTTPGEKYRAPDGTWRTRTDAAPIRDSRCI
jgi:uncharacterized protein YdbL (DUF1318 family)